MLQHQLLSVPPPLSAQVTSAYVIGLCLVISSQMYAPNLMKMYPSWQKCLNIERDTERKKDRGFCFWNTGSTFPIVIINCVVFYILSRTSVMNFFFYKTHSWLHAFVLKINVLFTLLLINHWGIILFASSTVSLSIAVSLTIVKVFHKQDAVHTFRPPKSLCYILICFKYPNVIWLTVRERYAREVLWQPVLRLKPLEYILPLKYTA